MFEPEEEYGAYLPWGYYEYYQPRQQQNLLPLHRHYQWQPPHLPPLPPEFPLPQNEQLSMHYLGQSCPVIDYKRLTSFLEVDNLFLTLWNWKPDDVVESTSRFNGAKKFMKFESGSLFTVEVPNSDQTR